MHCTYFVIIFILRSELEMVKTESLTYSHEKERSNRRIEDLNKLLHYKSSEFDKLNAEFRNFKISTETLKQCFKVHAFIYLHTFIIMNLFYEILFVVRYENFKLNS